MALQPIFIVGPHKSGSSLLRNLFDGTSGYFTCPVETHFFQLMGRWVDYDLRRTYPTSFSPEQILDRFVEKVKEFNERDNALGDADLKGKFHLDRFRDKFSIIKKGVGDRELIEKYFEALYYSLNDQVLPINGVIHKTVGFAEHARELKTLFPEAKFVHIVRNPYANLLAFRKFRTYNGPYPLLDRLLNSLRNNFYFLYKNQKDLKDYHIVRYEDLVSSPRDVMESLAEKLSLSFEENMLTPTSMGKDWRGNSTTEETFQGVDSSKLEKWKKEIHPMEAYFINRDLYFILRDFGYEEFPMKGFWKPAKKEGLRRYFYNRIYKFYDRKYH